MGPLLILAQKRGGTDLGDRCDDLVPHGLDGARPVAHGCTRRISGKGWVTIDRFGPQGSTALQRDIQFTHDVRRSRASDVLEGAHPAAIQAEASGRSLMEVLLIRHAGESSIQLVRNLGPDLVVLRLGDRADLGGGCDDLIADRFDDALRAGHAAILGRRVRGRRE